jgi:hypothetical protein
MPQQYKWDFFLDRIEKNPLFNDREKKSIVESLTSLCQIFDDEWLLEARETYHPLYYQYISNSVPWTQFWLVDFSKALDSLKETPNFDWLVKRLKLSKEYYGAKAEIEVAWKLKKASFDIEFCLDTKKEGPDIKASTRDRSTYFEVNILNVSEEARRAGETFNALTDFGEHDLHQFCKVHKILSKPHIQELSAKIDNAIAEVKRTKEYVAIQEPGVIDCLIIHRSKEATIDTVLNKLGVKRELSGPPYGTYEINRLRRNLRSKARQLPLDSPGIVIMYWDFSYLGSEEEFCNQLVCDIEEELYDHNHVAYWMIISNAVELSAQNKAITKANYTFVRKCSEDSQQEIIAIMNKYSKFTIDEMILKALIN